MRNGWFKLWRKVVDHPLMGRPAYLAVWVDILASAAHDGTSRVMFGGKVRGLEPGQFTSGAYQIGRRRGVPRGTVERIIGLFKSEELIEVQTDSQCSLITVKNWHKYQKVEEEDEERVRNGRGTAEERVRTNKEVKKLRTKELNNMASAPPPPDGSGKSRTPLQETVDRFFDLQGLDPSQRSASYPRHVRDAQALLRACSGDAKRAQVVLDSLHRWARSKGLDYTIGTALKQWSRFASQAPAEDHAEKMARVQAEIDRYEKPQKTP